MIYTGSRAATSGLATIQKPADDAAAGSVSIDTERRILCESEGMSWRDENPNCARTHAAFRLIGDALDPDATTRTLDLEPSLVLAIGQEMPAGRTGRPRRQRTGVWLLSTETTLSSTSLERHLRHLLDAVEPATAALHGLLSADNLRADFFCYWRSETGHGGPEVSPETLGRIAALHASLGIDFYGPIHN